MTAIIGFDYGSRKIGVAIGQTVTGTCQGLTQIANRNEDQLIADIQPLIDEWKPAEVVVGLPLNADNEDTPSSLAARKFGQLLARKFALPVYWVNEFLTSQIAQYDLRETVSPGRKFNRRKQASRDLLAAELILRSHLERTANR